MTPRMLRSRDWMSLSRAQAIAILRAWGWQKHPTKAEATRLYDYPGQLLLCCGYWQGIVALPHRCPTCHREYFAALKAQQDAQQEALHG